MNNLYQNPDWVKVLKEAKASLSFHVAEIKKIEGAIPYLEEMAQEQSEGIDKNDISILWENDFLVSKEEVDGYLKGNFIEKSDGRMRLFLKKAEPSGLYYKDFVKAVNVHGDKIKADSFFTTIQRVCARFGLENKGGGIFGPIQ